MSWDGFDNRIIANRQKETYVHGFLDISGRTLIRNGDVSMNSRLYVGYDTSLNGNVQVGGNLLVNGGLIVKQMQTANIINMTTTNYQLIVTEDISLNGRLFVSGNVGIGIGTTDPAYKLDIVSEANKAPLNVKVGTTNALTVSSTGVVGFAGGANFSAGTVNFSGATVSNLTLPQSAITSLTTDLAAKASLTSPNFSNATSVTSTNTGFLRFASDSGSNYIQSGLTNASGSTAPLRFTSVYNANTWMTIAGDGKVGIGSATPAYGLDIVTTAGNAPLNVKVGTTNALTVNGTGNVDIGGNINLSSNSGTFTRTLQPGLRSTITEPIISTNLYPVTFTASAAPSLTANSVSAYRRITTYLSTMNDILDDNATLVYNNTTSPFAYTGTETTNINGVSTAGEWLQLQLSQPAKLTKYTLIVPHGGSKCNLPRMIAKYIIVGSQNGSSWVRLHDASFNNNPTGFSNTNNEQESGEFLLSSNIGTTAAQNGNNITNYSAATSEYSYFRIVATNLAGATSTTGNLIILGISGVPMPPIKGAAAYGWNPYFEFTTTKIPPILSQPIDISNTMVLNNGGLFIDNYFRCGSIGSITSGIQFGKLTNVSSLTVITFPKPFNDVPLVFVYNINGSTYITTAYQITNSSFKIQSYTAIYNGSSMIYTGQNITGGWLAIGT